MRRPSKASSILEIHLRVLSGRTAPPNGDADRIHPSLKSGKFAGITILAGEDDFAAQRVDRGAEAGTAGGGALIVRLPASPKPCNAKTISGIKLRLGWARAREAVWVSGAAVTGRARPGAGTAGRPRSVGGEAEQEGEPAWQHGEHRRAVGEHAPGSIEEGEADASSLRLGRIESRSSWPRWLGPRSGAPIGSVRGSRRGRTGGSEL